MLQKQERISLPALSILNERGFKIDITIVEIAEQELAYTYIQPDDSVLELGARYGSVSCRINLKLNNKKNQLSVEPDSRVWDALEGNKKRNNCEFHIVKGCISRKPKKLVNTTFVDGYASSTIDDPMSTLPCFSLENLQEQYGIPRFTVLFADCEGCLENFIQENLSLLDSLRLLIYEKDNTLDCNYAILENLFREKGFRMIKEGVHFVWQKN